MTPTRKTRGVTAPGVQDGAQTVPDQGFRDFTDFRVFRVSKATNSGKGRTSNLQHFIGNIRSNKNSRRIQSIRDLEGDEDAQKALKSRTLPAITPCGTFTPTRAIKNLAEHNQLIVLDLDHLDDLSHAESLRDELSELPSIVCAFVSPRGKGVKLLMAIEAPKDVKDPNTKWWGRKHRDFWVSAVAAVPEQYRGLVDESGKDVSRLTFESWDPTAYVAPATKQIIPVTLSTMARIPTKYEGSPGKASDPASEHRIDLDALNDIDPPQSYGQWLGWLPTLKALSFSIAEAEEWSAKGEKYRSGEVAERWEALPTDSLDSARNKLRGHAHNLGWREHGIRGAGSAKNMKIKLNVGDDPHDEAETISDRILKNNASAPRLFAVNTTIVKRLGPHMLTFDKVDALLTMCQHFKFGRDTQHGFQGKYPPQQLVEAVERMLVGELPPLRGVKRSPFVWEGELIEFQGYHPPSGQFCDMPDGIDRSLTVEESLAIIDEFFGQFPYDSEHDRQNAIAKILGIPLKAYGTEPIFVVDKPDSQTGASKLCTSITAIFDGKRPAMMTPAKGYGSADENDKRLVAALRDHPSALLIDNISSRFESDLLAAGLTGEFITGRVLGGSLLLSVPVKSISICATGNNLQVGKDLINRSLHVRLNARRPDPELRSGFRYRLPYDILANPQNRLRILSAVCSIVLYWLDAGAPTNGKGVVGDFVDFQEQVSGLMASIGLEYNATKGANLRSRDTETTSEADFITDWWVRVGDGKRNSDDLRTIALKHIRLGGKDDDGNNVSLGRWLGHRVGKYWTIEADDDNPEPQQVELIKHKKNARLDPHFRIWQLQAVSAALPGMIDDPVTRW